MTIDPDEVFAKLEADRKSGELTKHVTTAMSRYGASDREGLIEQLSAATGERKIGTFVNGVFIPVENR